MTDIEIDLFTTCPAATTDNSVQRPGFYRERGATYRDRVVDTARWSEECGFRGMLLYIDNSLVSNWSLAQLVLAKTKRLVPLIATQPLYMHPYWAAKQIATYGHMFDRPIALNMLAGAFRNDLMSLGDPTPHDERYDRMVEYTQLLTQLLSSTEPVTFQGKYYQVENVVLHPPLDANLQPEVLMSGSSEAGMNAARKLDAVAVRYPKPVDFYENEPLEEGIRFGVRLGIIARDTEEEAWEIAHARFPESRRGQLTHALATKSSDSHWHKQLSALRHEELTEAYPYWLTPFQNYKTFCPYLVGTYERISSIVARYIRVGFRTFVTDIPDDREELMHQLHVFRAAKRQAAEAVA